MARIMAVADMYDALVTDRPYRRAMGREQALEVICQTSREGKPDARIVEQLLRIVNG